MRHRFVAYRSTRGDDKGKWTYVCRKCGTKFLVRPFRYGCKPFLRVITVLHWLRRILGLFRREEQDHFMDLTRATRIVLEEARQNHDYREGLEEILTACLLYQGHIQKAVFEDHQIRKFIDSLDQEKTE